MSEVIIPPPHPATHPTRKVRIVGPVVETWLEYPAFDQREPTIHAAPRYAGPLPSDPMWTYCLGKPRPDVVHRAWLLVQQQQWQGLRARAALPAGIDKPCSTIPCPPIMHTDDERAALKAALFRTSREPIEYR